MTQTLTKGAFGKPKVSVFNVQSALWKRKAQVRKQRKKPTHNNVVPFVAKQLGESEHRVGLLARGII